MRKSVELFLYIKNSKKSHCMNMFPYISWQNGRAEWSSIESCHFGHTSVHVIYMLQVFTLRYLMMHHGKSWTGPSQGAVRSCTVWMKIPSLTTDKTVASSSNSAPIGYRSCHVFSCGFHLVFFFEPVACVFSPLAL